MYKNDNRLTFSFPNDTWFPIMFRVDLDNDSAALFINEEILESWPFSYSINGEIGVCQLGSLNFFAGSAMPNTHGTYYVDDLVISQFPTTGISEHNSSSSIRIYPNPASDLLNITSEKEILNAEIMNLDGQLVKTISGHFNNVGISDLSDGFYFVKVYTENGTETLKFIKK